MNTTQQAEALPALIERFRGLHFDHAPDGWPAVRTREITALLDRITELESQLAQRFDAADMATAAAQGFRDGVASLTAQAQADSVQEDANCAWSNNELTAIYKEANGITVKNPPITTERIFAAMRRVAQIAARWQPAPATQQAGATKEHVRLVRVIADKIEDGTLFRSGIYSNKDLARFVRNVADAAAPQFPTTQAQAQADSVQEDAARYRWLREGNDAKHGAAWHVAVNLYGCEWDAAIDAARKQGEKQ